MMVMEMEMVMVMEMVIGLIDARRGDAMVLRD